MVATRAVELLIRESLIIYSPLSFPGASMLITGLLAISPIPLHRLKRKTPAKRRVIARRLNPAEAR
jgi:hypothetical protein